MTKPPKPCRPRLPLHSTVAAGALLLLLLRSSSPLGVLGGGGIADRYRDVIVRGEGRRRFGSGGRYLVERGLKKKKVAGCLRRKHRETRKYLKCAWPLSKKNRAAAGEEWQEEEDGGNDDEEGTKKEERMDICGSNIKEQRRGRCLERKFTTSSADSVVELCRGTNINFRGCKRLSNKFVDFSVGKRISKTSAVEEGEPTEKRADGEGTENCDFWRVQSLADASEGNSAVSILPRDDGYILGGSPTFGSLRFVDLDGALQGTLEIEGSTGPEFTEVTDVAPDGRGFLVVARTFAEGLGHQTWVGAYTADNGLRWETLLGPAARTVWGRSEALVHPDGGHVISWHDGRPTLHVARIDDLGIPLWQSAHLLAGDSNVGQNWAQGAADLLANGEVVQLTADGDGLRLVHTGNDGATLSDAIIEDVVAWPKDMVILPGDSIFVIANDGTTAMLLEVALDGSVLGRHDYIANTDPFLDAMIWDPSADLLFLGGWDRDDTGRSRPWSLVVDRNGVERANVLHRGPFSAALDLALMPGGGGVVVSRHGGPTLLLETITHCTVP